MMLSSQRQKQFHFKPLTEGDFPLLHRWMNQPEVIRWYSKKNWTLEEVQQKYRPYVRGEKPIRSFIAFYREHPIGYIQGYRIRDFPDYFEKMPMKEDAGGFDLYIGEESFLHKGLGSGMIDQFVTEILFADQEVTSCLIDPDPDNRIAIRAYEKAGFQYIKRIQKKNGEWAYIMGRER